MQKLLLWGDGGQSKEAALFPVTMQWITINLALYNMQQAKVGKTSKSLTCNCHNNISLQHLLGE